MATENGLEAVVGAAGLYLATSRRRRRWAAPALAGLAVGTHTSGLAWAAVIVGVGLWRAVRADAPLGSRALGVLAVLAVPVAIVLSALLWWTAGPERIVVGGGTVDGDPVGNLADLVGQLALSGDSYYFFDAQPALDSAALAVAALVAAAATFARWDAQLRRGEIDVPTMLAEHDGLRTLAVV